MYEDLKGKTILITGAGRRSGIGFAIAEKAAASGMNIVLADLGAGAKSSGVETGTAEEAQSLAAELAGKHGVEAIAVELDVTDNESVKAMAGAVKEKFGQVHALVNNAGTAVGAPSPVVNYDEAGWLKTMDVNLHGAFRVSKAIVPMMPAKTGSIINMSSKAGKSPAPMNGAYCVSKAALMMMTKVMAKELAPLGIRANALCPGLIMTDLQRHRINVEAEVYGCTFEDREKALGELTALGRLGGPDEVAAIAVFLASAESSYVTGQALNVCGGQLVEA